MGNDKNSIKDNTSINKDTSASSVAANSAKKCGRPKKKNWSRSKNNIKVAAVGDLTAGEEQTRFARFAPRWQFFRTNETEIRCPGDSPNVKSTF
ncbi:hypothetical protein BOX15_Mlig012332g1 [Macrostomum lignano]|uniref:Uncharacterized protein n=1 Tax=Macrostomum lignano TaxID=282301 RepID=A0A267EI45_9PLAT|nr:hypothetical protein BOX15_Mlig012332g1 [Macrostomum lignano]